MKFLRCALPVLLTTALCNTASAELLRFTFHDQAGDPRDNFDLTRLDFEFDNLTGDFWITAFAAPAHPFNGSHLLYLAVYNPDSATDTSFFAIGRFGFEALEPATQLTRMGTSAQLTGWNRGDRVASYDLFGSPNGQPFYSVLGGNSYAYSNSDELRDDAVITAVVPEPPTYIAAALCFWMAVLMFHRARTYALP